MLIINKKYSDLLKGYQRAVELDDQMKTDWELIFKPALTEKVNNNFVKETKEYEEKLKVWQDEEDRSLAEWQNSENEKLAEWQTKETARQIEFELNNKGVIDQYLQQKKQKSIEKTNWMIAGIICFILFWGLLIVPGKSYLPFFINGIISCIGFLLFCFSIASLIVFIVKSCGENQPTPQYIPNPKPQPENRIILSRPIEPKKFESILQKFECPSVLSRWVEEIQYKDFGEEYFKIIAKNNPQSIDGIPGEIELMRSINNIFDPNQTEVEENGIYILGLKIGNKDDIDGIEIDKRGLWILDSKYYAGSLTYSFGQWKHSVYVKHASYSFLEGWQEKEYNHPLELDKQWLHEHESVLDILVEEQKTYPWLENIIKGGLVFTHPNISVDIRNCPVPYSIGMDIAIVMQRESEKPELTFERRLEITDVLLDANRKYESENNSAVQLAEDIRDQLKTFLKEQLLNLRTNS